MIITDKEGKERSVASAGVGNTALGLSIGALGVELLRGGFNGLLGGLAGGWGCNHPTAPGVMTTAGVADTLPGLMQNFYTAHEVDALRSLYELRDYTDRIVAESSLREANRFYALDKQTDRNFFDMYVDYNNKFQAQAQEIGGIKTSLAVLDAVLPYVIKEATCDCVKADKFVRSSEIVYSNGCCNNGVAGYYAPFPPVVTTAPTTGA